MRFIQRQAVRGSSLGRPVLFLGSGRPAKALQAEIQGSAETVDGGERQPSIPVHEPAEDGLVDAGLFGDSQHRSTVGLDGGSKDFRWRASPLHGRSDSMNNTCTEDHSGLPTPGM
jgi:hypothetical protein